MLTYLATYHFMSYQNVGRRVTLTLHIWPQLGRDAHTLYRTSFPRGLSVRHLMKLSLCPISRNMPYRFKSVLFRTILLCMFQSALFSSELSRFSQPERMSPGIVEKKKLRIELILVTLKGKLPEI